MYTGKHALLRPLQPAFIMAGDRRNGHLSRAGGAQQPAGASVSQPRPEAARPLFDLHGEQQPLSRSLRRRRTLRPLLHLRELLSHRGRARLHPDQQPVAHPDHVEGKARYRARGAEGMPEGRALHRRRWRGRKRPHRRPAGSDGRSAAHPDHRRVCRHRDAVFLRHHGPPEGHLASAAGTAGRPATAAVRFPGEDLAVPRGHDLSVAGAALSFGAAGGRQPHDQDGRHRHHHGEVRSRAISRADPEMGRHAHPAGADDVLADAETAGRGAHALRPVVARDRGSCRRALPRRGQGRHHQMVGTDRPRILRRHRRARLHRLQQPGMAGPSRHRRPGAARRSAHPR